MNKVVEMNQSEGKKPYKHVDPVITDLNILIAQMIMSGKSKMQCANELKVSPATITHHVNRFRDLVVLKDAGDIADPINNERARLAKKFNKINRVADYNLKSYKDGHAQAKLAWETGRDIYKGIGVFAEHKKISGKVEVLASQRDKMQARIEASRQFGVEIDADIEIIEDDSDSAPTADTDSP